MHSHHQPVLRTDASGMPLEWIGYQQAARLYYLDLVAYSCGTLLYTLRGGINSKTGLRSLIEVNSIIATHQGRIAKPSHHPNYIPPLSNQALFRRDDHLCLYCGHRFGNGDLSRDHVTPISQKGADRWNNVVTACKRCNNHKAGRTPEQAGMQLLAIPFIPTHAEYIYLQGRRILSDQMDFLKAHFPRRSPLHQRSS
ncbi:MAG: HNH endonuclease [Methylococcaceae bacterium]